MQFEHAEALLLLLAVPGLYILYARYSSGRKETVLKFSSLDVITKAAATNVARRHLPFVLMAAAAGMSIVALADLQVPVIQADVADPNGRSIGIVLDGSGSMAATDYEPSRLEAAKQRIAEMITESDTRDYIGVVLFETGATTISYLTHNKQGAADAVMSIRQGDGATAIGDGLSLGIDMVLAIPGREGVIILLSDGVHNSGLVTPDEASEYAKMAGVKVHTIGMGSKDPVFLRNNVFGEPQYAELDEGMLADIANATGGTFSKSLDRQTLDVVFADIESELEYRTEYQSAGGWFAAATLALIVATMYVMYGRYRIVA